MTQKTFVFHNVMTKALIIGYHSAIYRPSHRCSPFTEQDKETAYTCKSLNLINLNLILSINT